jgi:GNAT superfamily N-acetyltransferase
MVNDKNGLIFTMDTEQINFDALADLYESVGYGSASSYKEDEGYKTAFFSPGSFFFFASSSDGQLVGIVRIFSDNKICSWIAELCVHPTWQKQGIGSKLLEMVIERFGHTAIYVEAFVGEESLYIEHGIKPKQKLVACSRAGKIDDISEPSPFMH